MATTYITFALCILAVTCDAVSFGDPCTVQPKGAIQNADQVYEDVAPPTCLNGSIWWNYPKGALQVTFEPLHLSSFTVCVKPGIGPAIDAVYEVTDTGSLKNLSPTEGEETCVKTRSGKVTLRMQAPEMLLYMTLYDYRIVV